MCEVWGWVKVMYGGVLVVKRLGNSDSCDVHGQVPWADMDLGMLDANIYI